MLIHSVRTHRSADDFPITEHLAYKIAQVAADPVPVPPDTEAMVINRIIDNAAVSAASVVRRPVTTAREQALAHPSAPGATVFGVDGSYSAEWAAWANGVAVRELDYHDTFLAAEYSHPGDNIPPLVAVAQQLSVDGADLIRGLATAYEIQIDLVKGISLHEFKIDHVAHLGPSAAAGLGAMLRLDVDTIYQAIGQALHLTTATRQSRKGLISSWKAYAPAFAGKIAIEAVDRALRGEGSPAPIWEGEDGVIAWLLGGPEREYQVPLPGPGEPKRAILDSYTKEHSAEYQSQAPIDLARRLRERIGDLDQIATIVLHTSHHTHYVIGTGSGDPQKFDPDASRETLDQLAALHLRGRVGRRHLEPRTLLCPRTSPPARNHYVVAQDLDRRRPGVDSPLPLRRPGREGVRGPRGSDAQERRGDHRRAGGSRRASAGRAAVPARTVHRQVHRARRRRGGCR